MIGPDPHADRPAVGPTLRFGAAVAAVLVFGFGGWAGLATLSGAVVAPGQIEIDRDRQVVQHIDGGIVAAVLTRDNAAVSAGTVLIRLDGDLLRSELAIVENQYFELLARRGRLEAERDGAADIHFPDALTDRARVRADAADLIAGQAALFAARNASSAVERDQMRRRQAQIASQIAGIAAQADATARQLDLVLAEITDQDALLRKGLTQSSRVLALRREEARLRGVAGELLAARAEAEGRVTEIGIEIGRLSSHRREDALQELRDLNLQELDLAERRRALAERIDRLDIRAPVSGIVQELRVTTPRSVIRPAEPILYIIPQDRPLLVATRIAPVHIDEIRPGEPATLRLPSFDMRTTPVLQGHLTAVSADTIADERSGVPYYRAEVTIDPGELPKLGGRALVPGMPVEVFVRTGDRSPMSYLLQPLATYFNRAFRES
jgi:HlyD family secretion protein